MTSLPRRYAEWAVTRPWALLLGSVLLSLGLGVLAVGQRYHDPYELWFVEGDPDLTSYRQLTRQYGEDNFVLVAFRDPAGVFTNRALAAVLELVGRLEALSAVDRVDAISNYQYVQSRRTPAGEDEVAVEDLIQGHRLPLLDQELAHLEQVARREPGVVGSLVGGRAEPDGRLTTTAVAVRLMLDDRSETVLEAVEGILRVARDIETNHGYRLYLAGVPVVEHAFTTFGWSETIRFVPLLLVTVLVLLAVVLRTMVGAVLPMAVIVMTIVPTLGAMAALGIWLNPLTTIVPQILIAVGVADTVHLVTSFLDLRRTGHPRVESVVLALERNFVPCLITSLTTMVGFGALLMASVAPVRQLGISAAIGVGLAWVFTMTLVPAALVLWRGGPELQRPTRRRAVDGMLARAAELVTRRPATVLIALGIVFLALASCMINVRVETSYESMFTPDTVIRQGLAFLEANLGGTVDLEISVDSGRSEGVKDPVFLATLERLQTFLNAQPEVTHTFSIVDVLKRMNEAMNEDDPAFGRIPDTAELSAQYLLLYTLSSGRVDLKERIDVDSRWTRLSMRALGASSDETQALTRRVRRFIAEQMPDVTANVTGKAVLYTTMQEKLTVSAFSSFASAFVIITAVMSLLFRSVKIALLSIVPNILPILATVGLMGVLDIPLDPGSVVVACIGIGIAVDDTVHFLSKYVTNRRSHSVGEAVGLTLSETGRPIMFTSGILALGFSLFSFSHFNFIAYFGQLATALILFALVGALLLLPALIILLDPAGVGRARAGMWARARRLLRTSVVAVMGACVLAPGWAAADTPEGRGRAIMQEQERVNRGYASEIARYRMTLVNANGDRSERVMEVRTLEGHEEGDRTLIVFKAPADINGTGLLTHQQRNRDDDQWLYLPALRRVRRIASGSRASSFVGSEFSYEDLVPPDLSRYRYRYVRDDTLGDVAVWIVESVPLSRDSGYSRTELFIRRDNHQTLRHVFYDRKGALAKIAHLENWVRVDDRWWRARLTRMENPQTRRSTTLELIDITIGTRLLADDLTTRALER